MSLLHRLGWRRSFSLLAVAALLTATAIQVLSDEPEIALLLGEPYEVMRQRSSAAIGPAIPGQVSFNIPKTDARLRFMDPEYGFVTPLASFFYDYLQQGGDKQCPHVPANRTTTARRHPQSRAGFAGAMAQRWLDTCPNRELPILRRHPAMASPTSRCQQRRYSLLASR